METNIEINPCRGCEDYDEQGGCKSEGGCADVRDKQPKPYWRWRRLNGEEAKTLDEWDKEGMWIDYVLERGEDSDVD